MERVELVEKYGSITAAAKQLGIARSTLRGRLNKGSEPTRRVKKPTLNRSVEAFANIYDKDTIIPQKIRDGIKTMPDWLYEMEFAKHAGISLGDLATYREEFIDQVITLKRESRRVWAKDVETANKLREML